MLHTIYYTYWNTEYMHVKQIKVLFCYIHVFASGGPFLGAYGAMDPAVPDGVQQFCSWIP